MTTPWFFTGCRGRVPQSEKKKHDELKMRSWGTTTRTTSLLLLTQNTKDEIYQSTELYAKLSHDSEI